MRKNPPPSSSWTGYPTKNPPETPQKPPQNSTQWSYARLASIIIDSETAEIEKVLNLPAVQAVLKNPITSGPTLLTTAIAADRPKIVGLLLKHGFSMKDLDEAGRSPLHWSVKLGSFQSTKFILNLQNLPLSPFIKDSFGVTPLHLAAQMKSSKMLKLLLSSLNEEKDIFSSVKDNKMRSPLHYAASSGSLECCEELLNEQLGLPIDQKDSFGQTPLICAAGCRSAAPVVRLLGMKKPVSMTARNKLGMSALHVAVLANNLEIIEVLLLELKCQPTIFDSKSRTPLHYAACHGRDAAASLLIKAGAKNDIRDLHGATPAHYAAESSLETLKVIMGSCNMSDMIDSQSRSCFMWAVLAENEAVVHWMLQNNSLSNPRVAKDKFLNTALHLAAQTGNVRIAKLLVSQGWSLSERDQNDATPAHLAAGRGHTELVRFFHVAGADRNDVDALGRTALFYAVCGGQSQTVGVMIHNLQYSIDARDHMRRTLLHYAAFVGISATIRTLIDAGCLIHTVDDDDLTPLHVSCEAGKRDAVITLIERGANVNELSKKLDMTPLKCAIMNGYNELAGYLVAQYGALNPTELKATSKNADATDD